MKLLSVIVPVYNVVDYVEECLNSIVSQTYRELEIIVVDDGSDDGSGAICDAYSQRDSRIIVVHQSNQGLSVARNTGLELCHGEYITFIDSDDAYGTPDVLEQNLRLLDENDSVDFVQFPLLRSDEQARQLVFPQVAVYEREERYKRFFLDEIFPSVWNKIYRSSLISGLSFVPGMYYEDQLFISAVVEKSIGCILSDFGYYCYRIRAGSIMQSAMTSKKYGDFWLFTVSHLKTSLRETPNLCDYQLNMLLTLLNMYLKIPVCRQLYKENDCDFFELIPVLTKKMKGRRRLLFLYYSVRLLGPTVTLWILQKKECFAGLDEKIFE